MLITVPPCIQDYVVISIKHNTGPLCLKPFLGKILKKYTGRTGYDYCRYAPDNNFTGYPVTLDIQPVIWLMKKIPSSLWYVFFHNGIGQHWYLCSRSRRAPKQSPGGSATQLESSVADPDYSGGLKIRVAALSRSFWVEP